MTEVELYTDDDGEVWAVWARGHISASVFEAAAREVLRDARELYDVVPVGDPEWTYMRDLSDRDDDDIDPDRPWHWCDHDAAGAIAVTAYRKWVRA